MATVKQYVNLPPGVTTSEGNYRDLRATTADVPAVSPGDRVEWWIEPNAANTNLQYLALADRASLQHPVDTVGHTVGASYAFENRINFPHVGDDKYVVKASRRGNRAAFLQTDEFHTWRRVYLTVYYTNAARPEWNALEPGFHQGFEPARIEVQKVAEVPALTQVTLADVNPNFSFMNGGPGAIISLRNNNLPVAAATLANKPFHYALLVVESCYYTSPNNTIAAGATTLTTGDVTNRFNVYVPPGVTAGWLIQARVRWGAVGWTDVRPRFALVHNVAGTQRSRVRWNFNTVPGLTTWLATAGNNYQLDCTLNKYHAITGYSSSNFCVVGVTGRSDSQILGTLVHETGHALGMVVKWEALHDAAGNRLVGNDELNPRWYDDFYGGQGPHCHTNAALVAVGASVGKFSGSEYQYPGAGPLCCTMYHTGIVERTQGVFCAFCVERLKRVSYNRGTAPVLAPPPGTPGTGMLGRRWDRFG